MIRERTLVSASALAVSLAAYWYARQNGKDSVPYVMIGGFTGALLGELITARLTKSKKDGN